MWKRMSYVLTTTVFSCWGLYAASEDRVTVETPQRPFYVNLDGHQLIPQAKPDEFLKVNALVELTVESDAASSLKEAIFHLEGAFVTDFKSVRLYRSGCKKSVTALFDAEKNNFVVTGSLPITSGKNSFYLKGAGRQIDPDSRIKVTCVSFSSLEKPFPLTASAKPSPDGESMIHANALRCAVALLKRGDDGSHSYRIPGLETSSKGTLIAVYDNRYNHSGDLPADIDVGMSRSSDGGKTWAPMRIIMDFGDEADTVKRGNGVGDPLVVSDPQTGRLWAAALWSRFGWGNTGTGFLPETTGQFVVNYSDDDGLTWSKPVSITEQCKDSAWHIFFNGPGKGITLRDGTLIFPAQYQDGSLKPDGKSARVPYSTIVYSKDKGKTWTAVKGPHANTTEAQAVELEDGSLMLNCRNDRVRSRAVYTTRDLGKTWIQHPTHEKNNKNGGLRDPWCQASLIRAAWKTNDKPGILLFSNPDTTAGRHHMTIKASLDDGQTWPESSRLLLDDTGGSYSCMTMINSETVGIFYEGAEGIMAFIRVPLKEIIR